MRDAFIRALVSQAERDPRVVLLTGDLGFAALEPFSDRFPDRFFNVGVAEQNMVGLATGLASRGLMPFAYSIATFASMRPFEFIRNGPVLHQLPVRVVGVGGGVDYGHNGPTHYALEDVALMRSQPGMTVLAPADDAQTEAVVDALAGVSGPAYLRLQRRGPAVPGLDGRFELGRTAAIGDGADALLVTYGGVSGEAVAAARLLEDAGVGTTVAVTASISPPPLEDLEPLISRSAITLAVEEHFPNGGIGSLLAELIAERGLGTRLVRVAVQRLPVGESGSAGYMRERLGLSASRIARSARDALDRVS